jgi:biotin carboxylase
MRTLLVLGAGEGQLPVYREARRLGVRTIGVDRDPHAFAVHEADEFLCVSTRDAAGVHRAVGRRPIAGVTSPASDASALSVRALALAYGTPFCVSWAAARASVDKTEFRRVVDRLDLPRYAWVGGTDLAELDTRARELTFPVAVKPSDSSGSKGISIVDGPSGLGPALALAARFSYGGEVIVEEYVDGIHLSAECLISNYRPSFMAVMQRTLTPLPHVITLEQIMPAAIPQATVAELERSVAKICRALDLDRGPLNVDVVVARSGELQLIEIAARPGGNGISRLVRDLYGVNLAEVAVKTALGEPVEIAPRPGRTGVLRILQAPGSGMVTAVHGVEAIRAMPETLEIELLANAGTRVRPYTQAGNKIGYLSMAGATAGEARAALERALAHLRIDITPITDRD